MTDLRRGNKTPVSKNNLWFIVALFCLSAGYNGECSGLPYLSNKYSMIAWLKELIKKINKIIFFNIDIRYSSIVMTKCDGCGFDPYTGGMPEKTHCWVLLLNTECLKYWAEIWGMEWMEYAFSFFKNYLSIFIS